MSVPKINLPIQKRNSSNNCRWNASSRAAWLVILLRLSNLIRLQNYIITPHFSCDAVDFSIKNPKYDPNWVLFWQVCPRYLSSRECTFQETHYLLRGITDLWSFTFHLWRWSFLFHGCVFFFLPIDWCGCKVTFMASVFSLWTLHLLCLGFCRTVSVILLLIDFYTAINTLL